MPAQHFHSQNIFKPLLMAVVSVAATVAHAAPFEYKVLVKRLEVSSQGSGGAGTTPGGASGSPSAPAPSTPATPSPSVSFTIFPGYGPYYCYGGVCDTQQGVAFRNAYGSYGLLEYTSNIRYSADGTSGWIDIAGWKEPNDRYLKGPDITATEYRYYKPIKACSSGFVVAPDQDCPV